jgi:predicted TIM-barrel fold metal-dependent hydrolase
MTKKWLVIDSHTHYLPEEAVSKAGVSNGFDYKALLKGEMSVPYKRIRDIEETLRIMDGAGIDMAVENQSAWSNQGLEICKAINNGYSGILSRYPDKFILCGHVPLEGGQAIVDEVERCINELGLHGMSLASSAPDVGLDDPQLWPMYERIQKLDVPVVLHPSVRFPIWGGGAKYNLRRTISREYDVLKATVEIMYGVFRDFPDLKFLIPHYGGGIPGQKARLMAWFEPEGWNVPAEIKDCPKTPRELKELGLDKAFNQIFDKIYFDMAGAGAGLISAMEVALLMIRPDRICFGTDYPYDMHTSEDIKTFVDNVKNLNIPENDKRLMLGENIKMLFKIK